jgi:hypothetical protein
MGGAALVASVFPLLVNNTRHLLRVVNSEALFPFWKNQYD